MSGPADHDELMARLAELPEGDVGPWRAEEIKRRAHRVMQREATPVSRWLDRLERIYARTLEPAVVFGVGGLYFLWTFSSLIDIMS